MSYPYSPSYKPIDFLDDKPHGTTEETHLTRESLEKF